MSIGRTPVNIAARYGNADCIKILAELGANIHTANKIGNNFYIYLIYCDNIYYMII